MQVTKQKSPEPSGQRSRADFDATGVIRRIRKTDSPRWMLVKDGLDHGPFLGEELIGLIVKGEAKGDHLLLNLDTGEKTKIEDQGDFSLFVEHYRAKRRQEDTKKALVRAERASRFHGVAKLLIAGGVVAVFAAVAIGFVLSRKDSSSGDETSEEWSLFERSDMDTARGRRRARRRVSKRRQGHRSGGSYEQAMNSAVDLGDVTAGGGQTGLSQGEVARVMNSKLNSIYRCVGNTGQKGLGNVRIDLAVSGNGQVLGASVRQGSSAFKQCVTGKVKAIRFPGSQAPRTGASFSFRVD